MAQVDHEELLAALERLDAATRALVDLSLRARYSDADVAGFLGLQEMEVANWRMNALNGLAKAVGLDGSHAGTEVALYLLDLPAEAWKRALPRAEPRDERATAIAEPRKAIPAWVRPMPRARLRDRLHDSLRGRIAARPARRHRLPADDITLMAAAAGAAVAAGLLATTISPPALLTAIGAVVLTAILVGRPQIGALTLIVLVALFPRSQLFEAGLPLAGGSIKVTDALVGATLAAWLAQAAVRPDRQRMPGRGLTLTLLLFLGLAILSISTARSMGTPTKLSLLELRPLLTLLLIFPVVAGVRDVRQLKIGVAIVLAASVATSLHTIFDYLIGNSDAAAFSNSGSRVLNTSFQYPMAGTLWALVFFTFVREPKLRWALLAVATIDLTAVFFTQQRGAWVALILALVCLFVLSPDSRRRRLAVATTALLIGAAVALVAVNAHSASRTQNIFEAGAARFLSTGSYDRDVSAGHRLNEWKEARAQIDDRPVSGIGLGSSITFWSPMYSDVRKAYGGSSTEYYIHNSYVWFALKMGLPGLGAFLLFLTAVFAIGIRGYRRTRDDDVRMILTGSLTTLVALMVLSLLGPHLNVDNSTPLLAGTIAIIAAAPALGRSAPAPAASSPSWADVQVSLVATVLNEEPGIDSWLASVLGQTRPPDEVVLVDGGSADGTVAAIARVAAANPRVKVHCAPGTTIAEGRNIAIDRAQGPLIAVTDAGTVLEDVWLERLVAPFANGRATGVASGFFLPAGDGFLERCIATTVTPQLPEIEPATFLPSSRSVAFRKEWWERVGGYPEWLEHCEDLVFDMAMRDAGAPFEFVPDARVTWRARPSLRKFFRQYLLYARGDGHALLWGRRHAIRYGSYLLGAVLLAAGRSHRGARLALLAGFAAYMQKFWRRLLRLPPARGAGLAGALAVVPVIVVTGDVAKMIGYPIGRWERATQRGRLSRKSR